MSPTNPPTCRSSCTLIALCTAVLFNASAFSGSAAGPLIFEAQFNSADNLQLKYGALIGPDGSGVSGQPADKSLVCDASKVNPGDKEGPYAQIISEPAIPTDRLGELTITAWYKPATEIRNDATLFNAYGTALLWEEKTHQWVLRLEPTERGEKPPMYWYFSGGQAAWITPGEWKFIAMVWRKGGKMEFYIGGANTSAGLAREMTRQDPVESITGRSDFKNTLGGNAYSPDRAFNGSVDDVRFIAKALDQSAIENIRQADLKNEPAAIP